MTRRLARLRSHAEEVMAQTAQQTANERLIQRVNLHLALGGIYKT